MTTTHTPGPISWEYGEPPEPAAGLRAFPPYLHAPPGPDSIDGEPVIVADMRPTDYEAANGQHKRHGDMDANAQLLAAAYTSYDRHFGPGAVAAAEADMLGECIACLREYADTAALDTNYDDDLTARVNALLSRMEPRT